MSYLNQGACAPSESSPPVKAACRQEDGAANAQRLLKLPLVSKALCLGLFCVSCSYPSILQGKRRLFLFLPSPLERLAGHTHNGGGCQAGNMQPRVVCQVTEMPTLHLSSQHLLQPHLVPPPELAGLCGSWF